MKKLIITIIAIITIEAMYAQSSLTNFEFRLENEKLISSSTYQVDIYLYNTNSSAFELRAGTVSFWVNANWRNGGTITPTVLSSELVTAQQTGTSAYVNGATDFFRRTIANVLVGGGTSIAAGSRIKMFTILLSNSVAFSTVASPNFACKFSGTNTCGFTYTDTLTTASAIAVNATTNTTTQNNCYSPTYWNGNQWQMGSTNANAATTTAPTTITDAVIYNGAFAGGLSCRNYTLMSSANHNLNNNTLNVGFNLANYGSLSSNQGTIGLTGTTITQTANQNISGTAFTTNNLSFGSAGNAGTKTLATMVSVTGSVSQLGTAVLAVNGNLTLVSNASGTARIDQLASSTAIIGNFIAERYIPSSYRRYRFLASPVVGGSSLQWRNNGTNTPGRGIHITSASGNGDTSLTNAPSAFKYTESLSAGGSNINSKWEAIDGNTALNNGQGYRVYIRGDRTKSLSTNTDSLPNQTTIWVSGTYPTTPVNIPVSYNPSLGNGWNLIGNPFPSVIDLDATSGWTRNNVLNNIWIYNPLTNSYGSYDGLTGVNAVTRYIASGQAFFIKAIGTNPTITVNEGVKISATPASLFKTVEQNTLRINLSINNTDNDETVIRFMDNKKNEFDPMEDVSKMSNPNVNISSYLGNNNYCMVNYLNSLSIANKTVPLSTWVKTGNYTLKFNQVESFDANINIYLKDNYTNSITDLRLNNTLQFNVDSNVASVVDGRLAVMFVKNNTSLASTLFSNNVSLNIYPNPANDELNLTFLNANFNNSEIVIYNVQGSTVLSSNMVGHTKTIAINELPLGMYFITVTNSLKQVFNAKFVKQ